MATTEGHRLLPSNELKTKSISFSVLYASYMRNKYTSALVVCVLLLSWSHD